MQGLYGSHARGNACAGGKACGSFEKGRAKEFVSCCFERRSAGKKAELFYEVLQTDAQSSPVQNLVKIRLLTGRHHQIRVQFSHLGTPLAGDTKYGVHKQPRQPDLRGLGLCACELEFAHPVSKKRMRFTIVPSRPVFQPFFEVLESSARQADTASFSKK